MALQWDMLLDDDIPKLLADLLNSINRALLRLQYEMRGGLKNSTPPPIC